MARFAPVCPPEIMLELLNSKRLGKYWFVLAHDVNAYPDEYQHLLRAAKATTTQFPTTLILDNSVVELKKPLGIDQMALAARTLRMHTNITLVLPDVYLNAKATVESIEAVQEEWFETLSNILEPGGFQFMYAPQGNDIREFIWCAEQLARLNTKLGIIPGMWGLPRNLNQTLGSRAPAVEIAHMIKPEWNIHLLGWSDQIWDDMICAHSPHVRGIDSTVPIRHAHYGQRISLGMERGHSYDWWNEVKYTPLLAENVGLARAWASSVYDHQYT